MIKAKDKIIVVIPARAGSERVKHKNTRPFAGFDGGLLELKLRQLSRVGNIDKIIVSSNDPEVLAYSENFSRQTDTRVLPLSRPDDLGRSSTPMSKFIDYVSTLETDGIMMMTHVTHPFVTSDVINEFITIWKKAESEGYDSLMTVTRLHKFIWDERGPYNYDDTVERWPRSQDIKPLFEVNHAAYIIPFEKMREAGDRVGKNPYLHPIDEAVAMDIDWEEQFLLLNDLSEMKRSRGECLL